MEIEELEKAIKFVKLAYKERKKESEKHANNLDDTRARKTSSYARHQSACEQYDRAERGLIELCEKITNGDCLRISEKEDLRK